MKSQRLKLAIGVFGLMAMVTTPAIGVAAEPDWKAVESITEMGQPLLPTMGVVTVMNFQPTADGKAAITGDFVLVDREVNPVAKTLRQHGIDVTAIHNHGLLDTPRLFYMHFWANDDPGRLARGLKAALDHTNSARAPSPR